MLNCSECAPVQFNINTNSLLRTSKVIDHIKVKSTTLIDAAASCFILIPKGFFVCVFVDFYLVFSSIVP